MHTWQWQFVVHIVDGSAAQFVRWVTVDSRLSNCVLENRRGSKASAALGGGKSA